MKDFKTCKLCIVVLFIVLLLTALSGCVNRGAGISASDNCDEILFTSFIESLQEMMWIDPYSVLDTLKKEQENTTDSITYYALLQTIANCYMFAGELENSKILFKQVMDFCEREEQTPCLLLLQRLTYHEYALNMMDVRENDTAIYYLKKVLEIAEKENNHNLRAQMYLSLGMSYQKKSDFPNASYYYQRGLVVSDSLKIPGQRLFTIYISLGQMYSDFDNYELAEFHFGQAEKFLDKISLQEKSLYYQFKGIFYFNMKNYPLALKNHKMHYDFSLTDNSGYWSLPLNLAISVTNIAEVWLRMEQYDSAHYYLNKAKSYYEQSVEMPIVENQIDLLQSMLALKENKLIEIKNLPEKFSDVSYIEPSIGLDHLKYLEELYLRKKDYENAYKHRLLADEYNDSIRNTKVRNYIAEMEMRYSQDTTLLRKDLHIAEVEGRASRWQSIAATSLLVLALITMLTAGFIFYSRRKREQEFFKQMATVTELRMEIVRNRLSPHFVFNALNIMMPSLEQHKELEQNFSMLIQLLRNNLLASEQIAVPLEDEINLVKNYLQLQKLSNPEHIKIDWQIAEDVPKDTRIPSMSMQIPVENAVKYAFTSSQENAQININISRQTNELHIVIEDNGIGYRQEAQSFSERGTGSGLKMLHRTVDLLNLRNNNKIVFKIENKQQLGTEVNGTKVSVTVPFEYEFITL